MKNIRSSLWYGLYAVLILSIIPDYFKSFPIPEFVPKVVSSVAAIYLTIACYSLGNIVFKKIFGGPGSHSSFASKLIVEVQKLWLGFGFLGTIVFILGWIFPGSLSVKLKILNLLLAISCCWVLWKDRPQIKFDSKPKMSLSEFLLLSISFSAIVAVFVSCFNPITYYDSLVYHLALPKLYHLADKIYPVQANLYSYFPANVEMLFLFVLNQFPEPEYVINLLGFIASISLAIGVAAWAYELGGRKQAIVGFFLWWTLPAVLFLSVGAYVDLPLGGFLFFAIRWFILARESQWDRKLLVLSGIFCGFAVSTKYTGAIAPIILGLFLLAESIHKKNFSLLNVFSFAAPALFVFGFWGAKNYFSIGNPFFPFFYQWLGKPSSWDISNAHGYFNVLTDYGNHSHVFDALIHAPWNLTVSTLNYGGGFDVLGDFGWPLVLFAAPLSFFLGKQNRTIRILCVYSFIHFLAWYFGKPVLRFLVGWLPVAVLLASVSLAHLWGNESSIKKYSSILIAVPWLVSNFFLYFFVAHYLKPFAVSLGFDERKAFLAKRLSFYPIYQYANNALESGSKLLLLGEQRTYHLDHSYIASNFFEVSPISGVCNESQSISDLGAFLKAENITHILLNKPEIERLGGLGKFGFQRSGEDLLKQFLAKNINLECENQGVFIGRIR